MATSNRYGAGVVLISSDGHSFQNAIIFNFSATNSEAKYEAIISRMKMSMAMGYKHSRSTRIHSWSQIRFWENMKLVMVMVAYQEVVKKPMEKFEQVHVKLVPRDSNIQTDSLARLVTSEGLAKMKEVTITPLPNPSTSYSLVAALGSGELAKENWMSLIIKYL